MRHNIARVTLAATLMSSSGCVTFSVAPLPPGVETNVDERARIAGETLECAGVKQDHAFLWFASGVVSSSLSSGLLAGSVNLENEAVRGAVALTGTGLAVFSAVSYVSAYFAYTSAAAYTSQSGAILAGYRDNLVGQPIMGCKAVLDVHPDSDAAKSSRYAPKPPAAPSPAPLSEPATTQEAPPAPTDAPSPEG